MGKIVTILVKEVQNRCKEQLDLELTVRDAAKTYIVEKAYDRKYGARPLKRFIQHTLETMVAKEIIANDVKPKQTIFVTAENDEFKLTIK